MSVFSDILGDARAAVTQGTSNLSGAVQQLASGNLGGAIALLQDTGQDTLNAFADSGGTTYGDSLSGMNARGDAIQNWCWYCVLPVLNRNTAVSLGGVTPSSALPWYYVQKATLPQRSFNRESLSRNGHSAHYPDAYSVTDLLLEFFMGSDNKAQQYIKDWQGLVLGNKNAGVITNQGQWGLPVDYKKTINLVVLSVDRKILLNVKYFGCWPIDPNPLELVSGQGEPLSQPVSFAVEDVNVDIQTDSGLVDTLVNTARGYALTGINSVLS